MLSHQYDIVSPMILDYEVDGPQHLRQQGGCLRLDPLRPVSSVGLVRPSALTGEFGRSRLFAIISPVLDKTGIERFTLEGTRQVPS